MRIPFARALAALLLLPVVALAADRDRLEDVDFPKTVAIVFSGTTASVQDDTGVTVTYGASTSQISIASTLAGVEYLLSGTTTDGYLEITSSERVKVTLDGVSITSSNGPALSMLSTDRCFLHLATGTTNTLTDSATYTRTGSGALYTAGPMLFNGKGSLTVTGVKSHAIYGKTYIRVFEGSITVPTAAKDAIHSKTLFRMDGGKLDLTALGDGIDGDTGSAEIHGGSLRVNIPAADAKGIGCDGTIGIDGGVLAFTVAGDQSKALSCDGNLTVAAGTILATLSGGVVLESKTGGTTGTYVDPSYCTALKSDGNVEITGGNIVVTHTGLAGKGISANGDVVISGGNLDFTTTGGASASYIDETGATDSAASDCTKADGNVNITGGTLAMRVDGASADVISATLGMNISGGSFGIIARGDQSKGLKCKGDMALGGGTFDIDLTGNVVLELVSTGRYDPSFCTGIKCDTNLTITGGTFDISHSGTAGKGVSVDGAIIMTGGSFDITTTGSATASFTNSSGVTGRSAADSFKADGNLTITGGTLNAHSTGTGGDAVSCGGVAVIGVLGNNTSPVITAGTTGARVLVSGSDYLNAKAFKSVGNLTINGGHYTGTTSTEGGEGLESKGQVTINGGILEITTYDDGINAATNITINGGTIYCYASNNDGIDSNGTLTVNGGVIVSSGANAPEEGFDCDQNTFAISGGIMVGTGGATSTPTASASTQRSVIYKGAGTANVILQVKSGSGDNLVYRIPRTYSGGGGGGPGGGSSSTPMTLVFSNPSLASGTTYSIISGATVSGGTEFHGLITGATVTGGTTLKTFNPTSMVTTVQ